MTSAFFLVIKQVEAVRFTSNDRSTAGKETIGPLNKRKWRSLHAKSLTALVYSGKSGLCRRVF